MNKLIVYPNCSKGGVTSVIRARAVAESNTDFLVVFFNDRGGRHAFDDLPNVSIRIIPVNRFEHYVKFLFKLMLFQEISVLSHPESANFLSEYSEIPVVYEFHSSNMEIIAKEIEKLNLSNLAAICAPSEVMCAQIKEKLPQKIQYRLSVRPNLIDRTVFNDSSGVQQFKQLSEEDDGRIPLIWVGRFDQGKGIRHFVRALAMLPENYIGVIVISLENEPGRVSSILGECYAMGVEHRIRMMMDLPQAVMGDLYRAAAESSGWLVSTSFMESFGYAVEEALACGLRCIAYDLPVWQRFGDRRDFVTVQSGETRKMSDIIKSDNVSRIV